MQFHLELMKNPNEHPFADDRSCHPVEGLKAYLITPKQELGCSQTSSSSSSPPGIDLIVINASIRLLLCLVGQRPGVNIFLWNSSSVYSWDNGLVTIIRGFWPNILGLSHTSSRMGQNLSIASNYFGNFRNALNVEERHKNNQRESYLWGFLQGWRAYKQFEAGS